MAKITLTELSLQKLKYKDKQIMYWDTILPGFGVKVSKRTKSFIIIFGKGRKLKSIGKFPDMSLREARIEAISVLSELSNVETSFTTKPYDDAISLFLEDVSRRLKKPTVRQYDQYLKVLAFDKDVGEITRADINTRLAIYDGKPYAQNYAYASLRAFFNWALDNEYIEKHPLLRGRPPNKTISRDRVLSDEELARIWKVTKDDTYGRMIRILILTGQRRMEVKNLVPEDIKDGTITFHTKGDGINILPLTPLVEENLILPFEFNNWGNCSARLAADARVVHRHHDLRRSLATNLARLGVDDMVIERVLGHTVRTVKFIYNRYSYLPEVEKALLLYEKHIRMITA